MERVIQSKPSRHSSGHHTPANASLFSYGGHLDNSGIFLQRKSSCACGGSCPSCQERSGDVKISHPSDPAEIEADSMADRVMRMPIGEATFHTQPDRTQHHVKFDEVSRKCSSCEEEELDEPLMRKESNVATGPPSETPPRDKPRSITSVIRSGGSPLDDVTRRFFEPRFGINLGNVRVHTDNHAAESARQVNARAYTLGNNVVFGAGQFSPADNDGRRLIAHELAHVVQQNNEPELRRTIFRSRCPHDAMKGSGCGIFEWKGPTGELEDFVQAGTDRLITAVLPEHLGGTWVPQLLSPPNEEKEGKERGFVDSAKVVSASGSLALEILEIKSRNTSSDKGGCARATIETKGYVKALQPLAPHILTISAGLAKAGGLRTDQCKSITAAEKKTLVGAGLDVNNPDSVRAWCLYNDLQKKLNRTFTAGFSSASFAANKDGTENNDYLVGVVPITCKRGKKTVAGTKKLLFEVNTKGGLSYRCDKKCGDRPEDEEEKEKEETMPKEVELPADKQLKGIEQPDTEDDWDPYEEEIRVPPEGIDVTDVAIVTATGVAAITSIHLLMKKAKTDAERRTLQALAEKTLDQMKRQGASQAARKLNSHNIKNIGTKAYQKMIKEAEEETAKRLARTTEKKLEKRLATRLSKEAAKRGAKTIFKAAGRALPVIAFLVTASEALAMADALSKGAELEIGFGGGDVDLGTGTDINVKGEKPSGISTDAKTEQTELDIELTKIPDVKGTMELETKQVKIKGKVDGSDGDPVAVSMKVKMQNTTLVFKSMGRFKGGNIVVDGGLEITDSEIEIDLPPDAVLDQPKPGEHRVIKGAKLKITKVGSGMGPEGQPATGEQTGGGGGQTGDKAATEKDKPPPPTEERKKLLSEINTEAGVKKIYDRLIKAKGIPVTDEVLRRLLALKEQLKQHPELVDRLIGHIEKGELKDPIKDLIEPMEAELKTALEEKDKGKQAPTPPPPDAGAGKQPVPDTPPPTTAPSTTAQPDQCKDADKFDLWTLIDAAQSGKGSSSMPDIAVRLGQKTFEEEEGKKPTPTAKSPVTIGRKTSDGLRSYTVWIQGDDMKPLESFDKKRFHWAADYEFTAPSGPIKSDQGDHPICFTDGGTKRRMTWGRLKKIK